MSIPFYYFGLTTAREVYRYLQIDRVTTAKKIGTGNQRACSNISLHFQLNTNYTHI